MRCAWALVALGFVAGCKRAAPAVAVDAAPSADVDAARQADAGDSAPRCTLTDKMSLGASEAGGGFDFGEGVPVEGGAIVGLLRVTESGRKAAVARVGPHVVARVIDLGYVTGDDPPPQPFVRGAEVFAAGYVEEPSLDGGAHHASDHAGGRGRRLTLFRVRDSSAGLVTIPQASDESPAFDVVALPSGSASGAIVVWDEDAPSAGDAGAEAPRGVIRAALLAPDLRSVTQVATVSPDLTDAERPRVTLRDGGFWVTWVARKREPPRDAGPELEAPGEDRAYRWVELLALDEHGRPAGALRRLSSASGHVAGFDVAASGPRLDAVIVLDDEEGEGAGGGVVHVVALAEGPPRIVPVRAGGAGRGTAPWLGWAQGAPGWLAYVDASDRTRLVALDTDGASTGADSVEPLLDEARPVTAGSLDGVRLARDVLAVSPGSRGELRWLSCSASR